MAFQPQTFFAIFARWPDEVRLLTIEHPIIETLGEALEALRQHPRAVLAVRCDPDCPPRDVSEDLALTWLDQWIAAGSNPVDDIMPAFVAEHITSDRAYEIFADITANEINQGRAA